MSETNPQLFLDYFENKINKNHSIDPYNLRNLFLKLLLLLRNLIKIKDKNNFIKLTTILNNIYIKYKILYKLLYKFSIRYVENKSKNIYTFIPLYNETFDQNRKIKIDEILKYKVLFDIYKYYLVILFILKTNILKYENDKEIAIPDIFNKKTFKVLSDTNYNAEEDIFEYNISLQEFEPIETYINNNNEADINLNVLLNKISNDEDIILAPAPAAAAAAASPAAVSPAAVSPAAASPAPAGAPAQPPAQPAAVSPVSPVSPGAAAVSPAGAGAAGASPAPAPAGAPAQPPAQPAAVSPVSPVSPGAAAAGVGAAGVGAAPAPSPAGAPAGAPAPALASPASPGAAAAAAVSPAGAGAAGAAPAPAPIEPSSAPAQNKFKKKYSYYGSIGDRIKSLHKFGLKGYQLLPSQIDKRNQQKQQKKQKGLLANVTSGVVGGSKDTFDKLPQILKFEFYRTNIYKKLLREFDTTSDDQIVDTIIGPAPLSRNKLKLDFDSEGHIFANRDRKSLVYWQRTFNNIVDKLKNNSKISTKEIEIFNSIENSVNAVEIKDNDKQTKAIREEKRAALIKYIKETKDTLEKQDIKFKEENIIDTSKIILDFSKVVNVFKIILVGLTVISIIIYIVVLIISIYNLLNLLIKIIGSIIYLFYNKKLTHLDTLSYNSKNITKCTKDNYSGDIFNVLNEQLTALSVFNTNIYIIYIILGYVILYLLYFIYSLIFSKYYIFKGDIKDIDPKFTLLTVIAIIFVCSFVHLLIYKFLFKTVSLNKFKDIDKDETNIDDKLKNYLSRFKDTNDETENTKFYTLLTDSTKKDEIDAKFQNMVLELEDNTNSNLGKYLLIYNLYIYFQDYLYMNDKKKELIKDKFDEMMKGNTSKTSFISLMDLNERRLIKSYHQELPFYNQIPSEKIEYFKIIDTNIGDLFTSVNKSIITYAGTFYPFLFTCIYILIICIYNIITTYIILKHISDNKEEQIFPQFIYTMADKIIDIVNIIYNLFNN
jgi:hypothetical protein